MAKQNNNQSDKEQARKQQRIGRVIANEQKLGQFESRMRNHGDKLAMIKDTPPGDNQSQILFLRARNEVMRNG